MPHQCTECGHVFADGSKEMLSGCPDCGGNKFQYLPEGVTASKPDPAPTASGGDSTEDSAQADARSAMIDANDLPKTSSRDEPSEPIDAEEPTESEETPDLSELREELNDQFESIRIVDHGQYELNLMELYKRQEFIIALQENGRYVIDVPESFRRGPKS